MTGKAILHPGQERVLQYARRFNVVACGRRWGKTTLGLMLAWTGRETALRTGFDVAWVAPSYKLMDEAWRMAKRLYRPFIVRTDANLHRMELSTGAALDFWTLEDEDAGRGRKYGLMIVDEAAMARHLEAAWNASLSPTLTDHAGGAWFFSTPKGRNYFWSLSQLAQRDPLWAYHHAPSADNPHLPAAEIERQALALPERIFAQEYLAQFLEDGGGVFRRVMAAVDTDLHADPHAARAAADGRAYVIGVDWGRHEDFTVITVIDARDRSVVAVDRFTQIDYAVQLGRLQAMHQRFPGAQIVAEGNSMGGPLVEQLRRRNLPVRAFQTTQASKAEAVESLALAFEQGAIRIPPVQWLIDELMAFDQERLPSGALRYSAPRGGHDDGVMSLAIAWHGIGRGPMASTLSAPGL
ncbi:MAG: hypothetical protein ABS84_14815 [Rubrivivax sp. SCN 71-131]|nr:MAG: hypothetical protein ABS84_14815 [Rubrivivax sp. SCN 71-131]